MLETFRNAWKVEDLRKKIIYTLIMLLIYRVGSVIPTPGVNVDYIAQQVNNISMLGMLDFINGQNFSNFTIFAMGISPYITSSIIMQLLTIAIPSLERLQKEGEEGRKKIAEITRVVTIALGCIMALGIILGLGSGAMAKGANANFFDYALVFVVLAAGTAFTMWIGERINPTGKKRFKQALKEHDIDYILQEGIRQQECGVHILDVNVGLPEIDEPAMLKETVEELQAVIDLPLQIDTSDAAAMEAALRTYNGKAMINSVNGVQQNA